MVASLQTRKEALEAKLRDKTNELKKLCIKEAELTGILPPEIPLEPGESPPKFKRKVNLSTRSKDSHTSKSSVRKSSSKTEALASLELECNIQTGIAEAALGLANDSTASKSVRRKHRILYEESQKRLNELENRLSLIKQQQKYNKKKLRATKSETGPRCKSETEYTHNLLVSSLSQDRELTLDKVYYPPNEYSSYAFKRWSDQWACSPPRDSPTAYSKSPDSITPCKISNINYFKSSSYGVRWDPTLDNNVQHFPQHNWNDRHNKYYYEPQVSTVPGTVPANSVLLPSQTYPDTPGLSRAQSLSNVDKMKTKPKEKEWIETSLDGSPVPSAKKEHNPPTSPTPRISSPQPQPQPKSAVQLKTQHATVNVNTVQFDIVVPYESPKNHTVVEAGKFQPYREVTKPFEMSDFYKYSTKFRNNNTTTADANKTAVPNPSTPKTTNPPSSLHPANSQETLTPRSSTLV